MVLFALCCSLSLSPVDSLPQPVSYVYSRYDYPLFPGDRDSLTRFFRQHTGYPDTARLYQHRGTVAVRFTVLPNGTIKDPEIAGFNVGLGLDKEALRLVRLMPPWIPRRPDAASPNDTVTLHFRFDQNTWNVAAEVTPHRDIFRWLEEPAWFPGGEAALQRFLTENLRYPAEARARGISGTVRIAYIVTEKKIMANIHPVGPALGGGLEAEALRIAHILPAWKGSRSGGRNIPSYDTLDVRFELPPAK